MAAVILREAHISMVSTLNLMILRTSILIQLFEFFNPVIADHAILLSSDEAHRHGDLLNVLPSPLLLLNPNAPRRHREVHKVPRVLEHKSILVHVPLFHVLILARYAVGGADHGDALELGVSLVEPLGEQAIVGGEKEDASEHTLSNWRIRHVCSYQAAKRTTK